MAPLAARFWGDPTARAAGGRGDRDQREDDDGLPGPRDPPGGRLPLRAAGDREAGRRRRREGSGADDAGGDRAAGRPSGRCSRAATKPARWRSPRTRSRCTGPTRSTSRSPLFTNLTQDHLDFHADMEDYFLAKRKLFETGPGTAIVNVDDPYGRRLAEEFDCVTFSAEGAEADYSARDVDFDAAGGELQPRRDAAADGAAGALQRRQRARRLRRRRGDGGRRRDRRGGPGAGGAGAGAVRAGRRGPGVRASSSTTRTRRTRWRTCCGRPVASPREG